jgi:hypothetical protein
MHSITRRLWLATLILPAMCFAQDQNINTQVDQSTLKKVAPDFAAATPSMAVTY